MGNVFTNAGDAWASALRIHQPDRDACKVLSHDTSADTHIPAARPGPVTSTGQQGICSFNYFSHAPGIGLRYHTPVGPIRLDFSYNLNPPIYPGEYQLLALATRQRTRTSARPAHFNFFFSLGQTF